MAVAVLRNYSMEIDEYMTTNKITIYENICKKEKVSHILNYFYHHNCVVWEELMGHLIGNEGLSGKLSRYIVDNEVYYRNKYSYDVNLAE